MNCKKCGFQLTESDQFCKNCGAPVNNISAQNPSATLGSQNMQGYSQPGVMNQSNVQPSTQYGQQSWTNGYNLQSTSQIQKNSNTKFIIIGIVVVLAIVGIVVAISAFSGNKTNNSGINNGGSSAANSSYTVKFNGFTFKIPTNLVYEVEEDCIALGDEEGTWTAFIEVSEGSYSQLLSNKSQIQSVYQADGFISSVAAEKTIGGMSFITIELSKDGTNSILGWSKANSMNLFSIVAYNINNEYDYKLLEKVSSILKSAEYTGTTNNISTFEKVDMNRIAELAK